MNELGSALCDLGSAMVGEANGRRGAVGPAVEALWPGARVAGPCRTAFIEPGDNLGVHWAVERCRPGEVLCLASTPAARAHGGWGEVLTRFARARGVLGLVTTIGVRDISQITGLSFPVFGVARTIQGTGKRWQGTHDVPVVVGRAVIRSGDWVVADADGVAVVRPDRIAAVIAAGRAKVAGEEEALQRIARGETSRVALGLP